MTDGGTYQSDTAPLRRALLKHARDAFQAPEVMEGAWRELG